MVDEQHELEITSMAIEITFYSLIRFTWIENLLVRGFSFFNMLNKLGRATTVNLTTLTRNYSYILPFSQMYLN